MLIKQQLAEQQSAIRLDQSPSNLSGTTSGPFCLKKHEVLIV